MSEFLVVGLAAHPLSPSFCCRSVWHQECKLDGVRRKTKTSKNFSIFSDVGWLVGTAHEHRERMRQTDILHPLSFQQVASRSVGRVAIVSSTMKKRDSWTRFGTEITALAAGKEEREEKKFPDFGGAEFAAAFTRFHVVLLGRRADRAPLVVNVAKKGIIARRAGRDF